MRHLPLLPLLLATIATSLSAQSTNPVAYPQETTQGSSGHLVPFGVLPPSSFAEGHTQLLFPANHLPSTGGALLGVAVNCQTYTGPLTYTTLNINASITQVTSLSMTFAQNMLAPQPVLTASSLTVNYTTRQWTPIMFTTPFVYPGGNLNLVLDIAKVVVPPASGIMTMQTTTNPSRTDLPSMVHAFGMVGSGASTATTATFSASTLQVELLWAGIPTMTLRSDPVGSGNEFAIGNSIAITTYGTPASFYLTEAGTTLSPISLPPVAGLLYVNSVTLGLGTLGSGGSDVRTLPIPANPALVGLYLAFQSGVLDAVTSMASWTSAADCFIRS